MAQAYYWIRVLARYFLFAIVLMTTSAADADNKSLENDSRSIKTISLDRQCMASSPQKLLDASFKFNNPTGRDFPVEIPVQTYRLEAYASDKSLNNSNASFIPEIRRAPEGGRIVLKLSRSSDIISSEDWQKSYLVGIAITSKIDSKGEPERTYITSMPVMQKDAQSIVLDAYLPSDISHLFSEDWKIIPILCRGSDNKLLGYGSTNITVISTRVAWALAISGMIAFWCIISYAAWQLNKPKLDALWNSYNGIFKSHPNQAVMKTAWRALEVINPVFISQDSLGYGSLARFQILIFTSSVGLVLLYIFIHSGVISDISSTVLLLLGVTVAGGTFARATGDWLGISAVTRQWLLGTQVLMSRTDKPRWSDLFETQGEIDVAKVQALLFTSLISFGILASGITGLSSFTLPDQIVYLSLISQGAYVFGKLLPADSRKKVEEDLKALRDSAARLAEIPDDILLKKQFEMARETARRTLEQTYVNRFDKAKYDARTEDPKLIG